MPYVWSKFLLIFWKKLATSQNPTVQYMEGEVYLYVKFRINITWLRKVVLLVSILVDKFTFVLCIFLPIHAISNQIYF